MRERAPEAASRLDRGADDDELGAALVRDARDLFTEQSGAHADDLAPHADAVRPRDRRGRTEPVAQSAQLVVEACVERQLALDEQRSDEHDPRMAVRGEPARELERVFRLLLFEQRHDDRAIAERARAAREPVGTAPEAVEIEASHRTSG